MWGWGWCSFGNLGAAHSLSLTQHYRQWYDRHHYLSKSLHPRPMYLEYRSSYSYGGPGGRATKHCTTRDFVIEQYSNSPIPRSSNVATVRFCDRSLIPFRVQATVHFRYRTSTRTSIDLFLGSNNGLFLGSTSRTFLRPTCQTYYGIYM